MSTTGLASSPDVASGGGLVEAICEPDNLESFERSFFGQRGRVKSFDAVAGRYVVRFEGQGSDSRFAQMQAEQLKRATFWPFAWREYDHAARTFRAAQASSTPTDNAVLPSACTDSSAR